MKKYSSIVPLLTLLAGMLACNFNPSLLSQGVVTPPAKPTGTPAVVGTTVEKTPTVTTPEATEEPQSTTTAASDGKLDPCIMLTASQAETILGEPAAPAKNVNGSCVYSNAKDGLYMVNIAAAQDKDTSGILQGQGMLIMFSGNKVSDDFTNKLRSLSDAQDFKGFFSELVAASNGSQTMTAKLFTGGGNDLVYWAWINAPPRRQGAFVAVRKNTLININVVLADTADGNSLVKSLNSLAGDAFSKLPEKFSVAQPSVAATVESPAASEATPTLVVEQPAAAPQTNPTPVPTGIAPPVLVSPADGTVFDVYPRITTLEWKPAFGATRYLVEIMACSSSNKSNCFSHPMIEQTTRETAETTYKFNFVGAQPGKWRVTAIGTDGKLGIPSGWWTFSYSK
jgi:hypothetical protein